MKNSQCLRKWIMAADLAWLPMAMILAWLLRYLETWSKQPVAVVQAFLLMLLGASLAWTILWSVFELDGFRGGWRFSAVVSHLLLAVTIVMGMLLAGGYLVRVYVSRLALVYLGVLMLCGFVLIRVAARWILSTRYRAGAVRRVVIVGNGPLAREAAAKIERHRETLCQVAGFLSLGDSAFDVLHQETSGLVEVRTCSVLDLLERYKIDEVIFAVPRNGNSEVADLMDQCVKRGIAVSLIPQPYELYMSVPQLMDLDGLPILRLKHTAWTSPNPAWKRILDLVLGTLLLVPCLPIIVVAAAVLKMKKGKGFCREERYGQHGKTFWMYRLNSPRRVAGLPSLELFMQHLSLTELPQLFNVLRGNMSLVGPRPEGLDDVCHYTDWHLQRLKVQPGMTGLAQVHGLRDRNPLEDKTRYDLQYILHRSLFQDVSLLLQTISTLLLRLGQRPAPEPRTAVALPKPNARTTPFAA
jgi:lipopolysaccharide/colanic/teichoic acid biosynthesis glycosyltransferase